MDRRQFVKTSVASAIALAGTLAYGCAPVQPESSSAASSSSPSSQPAQASPSSQAASGNASAAATITLQVNGASLQMTPASTEAASALVELLRDGPITVPVHPYGGFEEVGPLPQALPTSDEQITTAPGDVMLYQGNQITVFFGSNTWEYTRLGHIDNVTAESLHDAFGDAEAVIELSL